jgi:single-strand DNA-binding protein
MMNVICLQGRLVRDPELKQTNGGVPVTNFTIAVQRNTKNQNGERESDFIDIVCWRHTAEFVSKYIGKGDLVCLNGSLQTRSYEDKNGNKRKAFEVVADNVHFGGDRATRNEEAEPEQEQEAKPSAAPTTSGFKGYTEVDDDELPF